jgi:hypothetical protein
MTKTALRLLPQVTDSTPVTQQRKPRAKRKPKSKTTSPAPTTRDYHTVELVVPTDLYRMAQAQARNFGNDMAHVGRGILFAAMERDPVGPAPVPDNTVPEETSVKRKYGFEHLAYTPLVIPNVAKTRDNTRGTNAPYKNYRFRMPLEQYHRVRDAIVGVPGQTVTHVLEAGLQHFVSTGSY